MEKNNTSKVTCYRDSEWVELLSRELIPGDVISIPPGGCVLPADCALLTGECIIDEGMLTGESIPVIKIPVKSSSDLYNPESVASRASTLYGGTVILQTRTGGASGVTCTGLGAVRLLKIESWESPSNTKFPVLRNDKKLNLESRSDKLSDGSWTTCPVNLIPKAN